MSKRFIFIILLSFMASGCTGFIWAKKDQSVSGPPRLEPQMNMKFGDIPLPAGFKLLSRDSYSFQTEQVRVAVLKYSGRPNADTVLNFYKEQMSIYGWELLNTVEYGRRMLNFDRENETCIITIEPKKFSTEVIISLGPKQKIKEEKPLK